MASDDDKACSSAKKFKIDTPTECDTVQSINAQFPKIDNLQHFPEKVLYTIFSKVNDSDLLHLSDTSCRFESIARIVFKDKYVDKYFVFDDDKKQEMYEELFSRFGRYADVKAVKVKNIKEITENHWLTQLLRQYINHLKKLTFKSCSFKDIYAILSVHMNVEHLNLYYVKTNIEFNLPEYDNLKKLELCGVIGYRIFLPHDNLVQTIRNKTALESFEFWSNSFTFHDAMMMIAQNFINLQHLTLQLKFHGNDSLISDDDMDSITDSLKNLQSLELPVIDRHLELIQRLGLACSRLKHLSLDNWFHGYFSDGMFDALCQFSSIERIKFVQHNYDERIETVVGHMPNLRQLDFDFRQISDSNTFILSLLRNCPSAETVTITSDRYADIKPKFILNAQFWDQFNEVVQHPNAKVDFKVDTYSIGYIAKKEIVWKNMVMHWFEYDWEHNKTNMTLLDLAKPSVVSATTKADQKPSLFDHILGYLDLASLYAMSEASEHSKRLVEDYVKRHAQQNGTFTISDEFHHDAEGLDVFAEHVENLKVKIFDTDFFDHLKTIAKIFTKLNKLSVWLEDSFDESDYCIFPQARHLTIDANYPHLCLILQCYPQLETLETKEEMVVRDCCLKPLNNFSLRKLTFKNNSYEAGKSSYNFQKHVQRIDFNPHKKRITKHESN